MLNYQGLTATLSVTNVTKNEEGDGACGCDVALGVMSPISQVPRMFVLQLSYNF